MSLRQKLIAPGYFGLAVGLHSQHVGIVESFLYAELITGEEPDIAMAELAVAALLGRQDSNTD